MSEEAPRAQESFVVCTRCGCKMPAGSRFCTECGNNLATLPNDLPAPASAAAPAPAAAAAPAPVSVQPAVPAPAPSPSAAPAYSVLGGVESASAAPAPQQSNVPVVAGVAGGLLVAAAIAGGLFASGILGGPGAGQPSSSSAQQGQVASVAASSTPVASVPSAPAQPSSQPASTQAPGSASSAPANPATTSSGPAAQGASPSQASPASSAVPATPEPAVVAPAIDLADAQQYYDANIFLSNFAENWVFSNGYDRASYRMTEVLEWAFMHNALNAPDRLETGTWLIEGTMSGASEEFVGDIGAGGPVFSRRMQTEHITRALERYLGLLPDLAGIDTASDQDYGTFDFVERDGYLYEGVYRGSALFHDNVVICTSAQAEGDNLVRLQFNVYKGGNEAGKVHQDTAWYGFSVQQVEASGGELAWTGEAVVEVRPGDEHPLKLVSMKRH